MQRNTDVNTIVVDRLLFEQLLQHAITTKAPSRDTDRIIRHVRKWNPTWRGSSAREGLRTTGESEAVVNMRKKHAFRNASVDIGSVVYVRMKNKAYRPYRVIGVRPDDADVVQYHLKVVYEESVESWFNDNKFCSWVPPRDFVFQRFLPEDAIILDRHTDTAWRDARTSVGVNLRIHSGETHSYIVPHVITQADVENQSGPLSQAFVDNQVSDFKLMWWAFQKHYPQVTTVQVVFIGTSVPNQRYLPVLYYTPGSNVMDVCLIKANDVEPAQGPSGHPRCIAVSSDIDYAFQPFTANKPFRQVVATITIPPKRVCDDLPATSTEDTSSQSTPLPGERSITEPPSPLHYGGIEL